MATSKGTVHTNYEDFFISNEPPTTGILSELYTSVDECADVMFFKTEEVDHGKVRYIVTAAGTGEKLLLTEKSRKAFLRYVEDQNPDPELSLEERAAFEYDVNNPHS